MSESTHMQAMIPYGRVAFVLHQGQKLVGDPTTGRPYVAAHSGLYSVTLPSAVLTARNVVQEKASSHVDTAAPSFVARVDDPVPPFAGFSTMCQGFTFSCMLTVGGEVKCFGKESGALSKVRQVAAQQKGDVSQISCSDAVFCSVTAAGHVRVYNLTDAGLFR